MYSQTTVREIAVIAATTKKSIPKPVILSCISMFRTYPTPIFSIIHLTMYAISRPHMKKKPQYISARSDGAMYAKPFTKKYVRIYTRPTREKWNDRESIADECVVRTPADSLCISSGYNPFSNAIDTFSLLLEVYPFLMAQLTSGTPMKIAKRKPIAAKLKPIVEALTKPKPSQDLPIERA